MPRFPFTLSALVLTCSPLLADPASDAAASLEKNVLPVLEQRCFDCHDAETKKGDINLAALKQPGNSRSDIRLWDKVREQLHSGTMPPKNKTPLEPAGKQAILDWVTLNEKAIVVTAPTDPGSHKTRRLNREEYSNSLRDLLGISARVGDLFPADGSGGEGFQNNADTLMLSTLLIEKYMTGAEAALAEVWKKPELIQRLFAPVTSDKLPPDKGAELALRPFMRHAYRRPPTEEEVAQIITVFNAAFKRDPSWDKALQVACKAVLLSPKFLFLEEKNQSGAKGPWQINDYELASRLSYFLWSSLPDDELLKLADEKKLGNDAMLATQVKRMLADSKADAFTKNFAGQWFRYEELFITVDPDRGKFKEFNDTLRQAMYDEIAAFSGNILRRNGRVLDFLDSDYTFLNEPLANLYGIPEVKGKEMRQVKFTDNKRGGILGMSAILATTSYPRRTSPVLRGKWVLENLLSAPPPPPPANVGSLPEDDRSIKGGLTFRQSLEQHRNKPVCAGCHARMDPLGFGLENFNAIGQWRGDENGKPLDTTGELPDGRKFGTPAEMRKVLLQEKDKFSRTLCSRLMGYALSRGLEVSDQPTLLRLEQVLAKNDYHSEPLIIALVQSHPFRYRR